MTRYKLATPLEAFRAGDKPGQLRLELATLDDTPVSLNGIVSASAELVSPAGVVSEPPVLVAGATSSVAVEPAPLIVEAKRSGWHTLASARAEWADAPRRDISLYTFLEGAREQCEEYAPTLDAGARAPLSWRQAQLMQARNCWNAAKTDPATGGFGGEELVFRPYPMDQTVRYLLRPKRAIGASA